MDNRFAASALLFAPAALLTLYFLKLPNSNVLWGLIGAAACQPLVWLLAYTLHRSDELSEQILIAYKRQRRSDRIVKMLFDPRPNLFLWLTGAVIGFYFGLHASIIWTMVMEKAWIVAIPMIVYAATCVGAFVLLMPINFVKSLLEMLFIEDSTPPTYNTPAQVFVKTIALISASEVAGLIGLIYISVFAGMFMVTYATYENFDIIQEHPAYYYCTRFGGAALALMCVCNLIMCLAMRNTRRRRRREEQRREAEMEMETP